jgi:hypothetical protein
MPDSLKNLSVLIAEQIETSWERCEASSKAMMVLDHLADEGRVAIERGRAQLAKVNSLLAERQRKALNERGRAEHAERPDAPETRAVMPSRAIPIG